MTDNNWPNPERPGEPMYPERDGLHVALGPFDETPVLILWKTKTRTYLKGGIEFTPEELLGGAIIYHGPCLTPTQISQMLAAEREKCAHEAIHIGESWDGTELSPCNTARHIAQAIRNLGAAP